MPDHENRGPANKRTLWNKGKLIGARPPLRPKHVCAIRTRLLLEGRIRDVALFNLAIDSKLRGCDVVALKVEDVAPNGHTMDRATVRQKKTGLRSGFSSHTSQWSGGVDNAFNETKAFNLGGNQRLVFGVSFLYDDYNTNYSSSGLVPGFDTAGTMRESVYNFGGSIAYRNDSWYGGENRVILTVRSRLPLQPYSLKYRCIAGSYVGPISDIGQRRHGARNAGSCPPLGRPRITLMLNSNWLELMQRRLSRPRLRTENSGPAQHGLPAANPVIGSDCLLERAPPYALEHCGNPCRCGAPAPTFLHKYERPSVIELAGRANF